jgi:signal transduction histidine kinase
MNRFFRMLPLQAKLMLIGLIPFCFLLYTTIDLYREKTEKLRLFEDYKTYMTESANINGLIDALQEERKYSFDYAMTKAMRQQLVLQRPRTDAWLHKLTASEDESIRGFTNYTKLKDLNSIRNKVDSMTIDANGIMHFYSNTVFRLNTLNTIPPANTPYLKPVYRDLMAQKILSEMITYLGIIRSNIYNVLQTRKYMIETMVGTVGAHDIYNSYEEELLVKAPPEILAEYKNVKEITAFKPTIAYIDDLFKRFTFDETYTAPEWWKVSDEGTNELRKLQGKIWKQLNTKVNRLYEDEKSERDGTLIFLIVALIAVIVVVCYIVHLISRNLIQLKKAAEKISNGETNVMINIDSDDAIGSLAHSMIRIDKSNQHLATAATEIGKGNFNIIAEPRSESDRLGNAIVQMKDELRQYNQKMEQLVSERTEALARSNEDLQQFAHVASHDLKEPLRKIATFSSILIEEQKDVISDRGKLFLNKIELAAQRMSSMIEGVLAYSTLASKEQPFEKVDLNQVMDEVESDLELAIIQKEAKIRYDKLPQVDGVRLLLYQLFYNLLNNALKFAREDIPPQITITSETTEREIAQKGTQSTGKFIHIKIADNGIGFNPEYAEQMFGVFSRLNPKDKYEGTGLGLALCRKIVHRHGGEIYAEGEEGEGATFHIFFPLK